MPKQLRVANFITFSLVILSAAGFVVSLAAYYVYQPLTLRFEAVAMLGTWWEKAIITAFFLSLMFHFAAMLTTILEIRYFGGESSFRRVTLVVVVISFMGLCGNMGLLSDIYKESIQGWDVSGEWYMLYLSLIPQALAHGLIFYSMYRLHRYLKQDRILQQPAHDDTMFYAVHYTGLLCGAVGLWVTVMAFVARTSLSNLQNITPLYNAIILTPYLLLLAYWLLTKRRERVEDWYDEKQMADSMKAGFSALLISFPVMTVMYVMQHFSPGTPADILWFPLHIHIVLVMFSGMTLYLKEN